MRLFDSSRKETWTGSYTVNGRPCELEPVFMRVVGDQYACLHWRDTNDTEFVLKRWFASVAVSV